MGIAVSQKIGQTASNLRSYFDKDYELRNNANEDADSLVKFLATGKKVTAYTAAVLARCAMGIWPTDFLYFSSDFGDIQATCMSHKASSERFRSIAEEMDAIHDPKDNCSVVRPPSMRSPTSASRLRGPSASGFLL